MKHYYRHPKTTQEKRANQENWHRGKRSPRKLPDTYWDIPTQNDNCWKSKRKNQYYHKSDYVKRSIILEDRSFYYWYISEYFEENNIPFSVKTIYKKKIGLMNNKPYFYKKTIGHKVTWWYNKDVGLKYLLKQIKIMR